MYCMYALISIMLSILSLDAWRLPCTAYIQCGMDINHNHHQSTAYEISRLNFCRVFHVPALNRTHTSCWMQAYPIQPSVVKWFYFLADRTNGRAYATMLCPSVCLSVACNACSVAKRCVLPKMWEMAYGESNSHVTDDVSWPRKVQHLENSWRCYLATIANY